MNTRLRLYTSIFSLLPSLLVAQVIVKDIAPPPRTQPVPVAEEGRVFVTPVTVDILVAYTPAARIYAGGTNAMVAAVNTHIALANQCYTNSDMPITLRAVAILETNYTEAATFNDDLSRLQNASDGRMDELHAARTSYGADLVALIRRDAANGVAGLAYVNSGNGDASFAPWAFSVTADIWASGNIAFPHELGHNFGCWHDRANSSGATHAYAYGWRFYGNNGVQYITVMAYNPGSRIPFFSNPTISYQGQPTGVASGASAADNAMRHEITLAGTSAYRTVRSRPDFDGNGTSDLLWTNTATGARLIWLMNSAGLATSSISLGTIPVEWETSGVADFDGNGTADILWSNTVTGARLIWLMNAAGQATGTLSLGYVPVVWVANGTGDVDANGTTDIIWTNSVTGLRLVWLMNTSGQKTGLYTIGTVPIEWKLNGAGDFDGNGASDLVWSNANTGLRLIWLMNSSGQCTGSVTVGVVPSVWEINCVADMNGNGVPDIVFSNTSTGARLCWLMNGAGPAVGSLTFASIPVAWRISRF